MSEDQENGRDRLAELEENFRRRKRNRTQLYWMKYNPVADYKWDLVDAREDVEWMIAEIKRLRSELAMYRELTEELKRQIRQEIGGLWGEDEQ
ncbi:MAG: hypothetical protein ACOCYG_07230 [Spirochaetota bacterium]